MSTEAEWLRLREAYQAALAEQFESRPDLRGKTFRAKPGSSVHGYIPMSFSMTLIDIAGGIWQLERDWEAE